VKIEILIFWILTGFFAVSAAVYTWLTELLTGEVEWVGAAGLALCTGLALMIAGYLKATSRRIDPRPEDDPLGRIEEHGGEQGHFSPWSWWPLPLAAAGALVFLGAAVGWWVSIIGAAFGVVGLVGWVYEYYRGQHAH
jgi:hypothetical protein